MMKNKYLIEMQKMTNDFFENDLVKIYLFGSWAKDTAHHTSDIDIAIEYSDAAVGNKIVNFREKVEESYIPYNVDIVDMNHAGIELINRIKERKILAGKALVKLKEIVIKEQLSEMERDALIQRFEFTFDIIWECAKEYLWLEDGIEVASPKKTIRACRESGIVKK